MRNSIFRFPIVPLALVFPMAALAPVSYTHLDVYKRQVGAFNPDLTDVRIEQKSRDGARRVHGPLKRFIQFAARHIVGGKERHADGVQACLHRDALR